MPWAVSVAKRAELARVRIDPLAIAPQQFGYVGGVQHAGGRPRRHEPSLYENIGERLGDSANVAVRDGPDVLMLERHERESRRAKRGGEIALAPEKPRMIEILLEQRRIHTCFNGCTLPLAVVNYPGVSGSQSPPVAAGSAVVRRACIA